MAKTKTGKGVMGRHVRSETERMGHQAKKIPTIETALSLLRKADACLSDAGEIFSEAQSVLRRISEREKQSGTSRKWTIEGAALRRKVLGARECERARLHTQSSRRSPTPKSPR